MVTATPSLTQLDASTTDATYATDATAHVATAEQAVVTKEAAPSTDAELGDAKKGYVPKPPAEPASATENTIGSLDGFNLAWLAPPPDALHCMEAMSSLASTATTEASQPSSQVSEDADAGADTEGTPPCKKPKSLHVATLVGAVHAPLDDALGGLAPLAAQPPPARPTWSSSSRATCSSSSAPSRTWRPTPPWARPWPPCPRPPSSPSPTGGWPPRGRRS